MAPAKRKTADGNTSTKTTTTTTMTVSTRVTRSSTRLANKETKEEEVVEQPVPKTKKARVNKKSSTEEVKPKTEAKTEEAAVPQSKAGNGSKTIVIEHCKQCTQFKIRAVKVKLGLEKGVPGITVLVNPEKPRRGCFEIREEGGEKFVSLLDMKRPFTPMKELDMDALISDMISKIK